MAEDESSHIKITIFLLFLKILEAKVITFNAGWKDTPKIVKDSQEWMQ